MQIRTVLCSTNAIESLNVRYRRAVKARGHFPTEQAALKCLYLVTRSLGPDRDQPHPVGGTLEARFERLRYHLRRSVPGRRDLLTRCRKHRWRDRLQRGAEPAHRGPCNDQSVAVGLPVSLTVLTEGLFAMLGGLAAALIVFAVAHAVTVVSLACRPQAGPAFAALTAVCRAGRPSVQRAGLCAPRVSVHLPCHAEPGQIVIGTLDCLARLNYPDFEVLVIDNNTADPEFWLPVKANPAPGCPHNKYARTPQRAGNPVPRGGPSQASILWSGHWTKISAKFVMAGTPGGPSADRTRPTCRP